MDNIVIVGGVADDLFLSLKVRVLPAHVKASVAERLSGNGNSGAFPVLAAYIGVTRAAQNNENQVFDSWRCTIYETCKQCFLTTVCQWLL